MPRKRRTKSKRSPEIPVASFADIAFLLIVYFLLATTLQKTYGFETEVPQGEKGKQPEKTPLVMLKNEVIVFKDREVPVEGLRAELAKLNLHEKQGEAKVVMLETAGAVQYQLYFEVMATIHASGGVIAIVREAEGEGGGG